MGVGSGGTRPRSEKARRGCSSRFENEVTVRVPVQISSGTSSGQFDSLTWRRCGGSPLPPRAPNTSPPRREADPPVGEDEYQQGTKHDTNILTPSLKQQ